MVISVIGIRFCCQLYWRRLGPFSYLQTTRERESESDSESDSADTEVRRSLVYRNKEQNIYFSEFSFRNKGGSLLAIDQLY